MKIENAVVLVTGANRGIGRAFARALLARGAGKVYAGARDPATVTQSGVQALRLDVNSPEDVTAAAALAPGDSRARRQTLRHRQDYQQPAPPEDRHAFRTARNSFASTHHPTLAVPA
jgi:NAD(P)-dependent dehydrogenase (short-subunit alcohol dehydrogenase family)